MAKAQPDTDIGAGLQAAIDRAALDPEAWKPLVELLLHRFGGEGGGLNVTDPTTGASLQAINYGLPAQGEAEYYTHFFRIDPRIAPLARMASGTAFSDGELLTASEIDRHPFYGWQADQGFRHALFLKLVHDARHLGAISISRRTDRGAFSADDLALARRLAPRLAQAAQFSRRVAEIDGIRAGLEAAVTAGARAFAMIDRNGRLIHANPAFAAVLARGDGLGLDRGWLTARARGRRDTSCVGAAITVALATGRGRAMPVQRFADQPPYRLVLQPVTPVLAAELGFDWGLHGALLLFLDDPDASDGPHRMPVLQQLFGLTRSEAVVAMQIANGADIDAIAALQGVAVSTVRTHLKSVFAKLGVSRQLSVAQLVRGLPQMRL